MRVLRSRMFQRGTEFYKELDISNSYYTWKILILGVKQSYKIKDYIVRGKCKTTYHPGYVMVIASSR